MTTTNIKTFLLKIFLAGLVLLYPQNMGAQHLQASLSHYSTEDGLPSNTVAKLRHDDYGFLWLATWNGISRFDGYQFYNYKTGRASGIRGLHNRVDDMIIDQAQNVWLKMYDGRMFVINRKTDKIEDPMQGISGHEDFHVDYFFTPYVTSTGEVLISYGDVGLYKLRLDQQGLKQELIMTGKRIVNCVVEGYRSDLWVGTNEGIHRIDMGNLSLENKGYMKDEHITRLATNGYNIFAGTQSGKIYQFSYGSDPVVVKDWGKEITGLFVDSHGLLWFSDLGDGAYRLNPDNGDVKFFNQRVLMPEFTSRGAEFSEVLGVVWVRMNHGGYGYYNRDTDEIEYFHNDPVNPWNLSNTVNARLEMNDGVVWESTNRRGLEKLEVLKKTIERRLVMPGAESPLDNEVRAMCYDKKRHHTLLANKHGRIFVYDDNGNLVSTITHDSSGKPISRPYGMSVDSKGNYWVCDKDNGLFKITPTNGGYNIINLCHDENDKWSLSSNAAYQVAEDKHGNIWVATYGGGVNILRQDQHGKYIALHSKNSLKKYPKNAYSKVRTIAAAKDGSIWAGSTDGILIMSMHNNNVDIEPMKEPENMQDGLMSNDIVNLACDPNGTMWVGTNSGGLSHTTEKDANGAWLFENYGIEKGLPSEEIYSITFDEKGNVWFATDHILCSFDASKKIFTTFSQLDGVDDTMCSEGSAMLAADGKIYFGTMNGYYVVDRSKLKNATGSLLKLRITNFFLNDIVQSPRLTDTYDYYVPESKSVKIPEDGTMFSFSFAALNYQLQHRIVYQYMLEGYDDDWQNADKLRKANYTNVPPGKYTFQVKAFLLESPEAYDMRTIEVIVPYYFFSITTIWIGLVVLLVGLIGGFSWWYYKRRFKKKSTADKQIATQEKKDEQSEEKGQPGEEKTDEYEIIES